MSLLVVAPGMSLEEVQRRSDVVLGVHRREDGSGVAQPRHAHAVHVEHPTHAFLIPEGLFTVVELAADRVARFVASPQLDAMPLKEATRQATLLAETMERAGWTAAGPVAALPASTEIADTLLGVWQVDGWRSTLMLKPVYLPSTQGGQDELAWILSLAVDATAE